jgi:hypothetical protein
MHSDGLLILKKRYLGNPLDLQICKKKSESEKHKDTYLMISGTLAKHENLFKQI